MPRSAFSRPFDPPPAWAYQEGDAEPPTPVEDRMLPHQHRPRQTLMAYRPDPLTVVQVCDCGAVRAVRPYVPDVSQWVGAPKENR